MEKSDIKTPVLDLPLSCKTTMERLQQTLAEEDAAEELKQEIQKNLKKQPEK